MRGALQRRNVKEVRRVVRIRLRLRIVTYPVVNMQIKIQQTMYIHLIGFAPAAPRNSNELESYLIEITAIILAKKDEDVIAWADNSPLPPGDGYAIQHVYMTIALYEPTHLYYFTCTTAHRVVGVKRVRRETNKHH